MKKKVLHTDQEVRIFNDPYRSRIMELFFIHKGKSFTSKQIADMLGEPPSKVNYHIKKLASIDVLHIDHTEMIYGITATFYILPYDTVALDKESVTTNLYRKSVKDFRFHNYNIFKGRFENQFESVLDLADEDPSKDKFFLFPWINTLYVNEDEYMDLIKKVNEILLPYTEPKEGYNEYSYFGGIAKTKHAIDKEYSQDKTKKWKEMVTEYNKQLKDQEDSK